MFEDDNAFETRRRNDLAKMSADKEFRQQSVEWFRGSIVHRYSYNFRWMGLPIIQYPADIVAMQELIWSVRPRCIVETGIARGGSLVFYASMLKLLCEDGFAIGVELALGEENRRLLSTHPMADRTRIVDGSSVDPAVVDKVASLVDGQGPVLVVLDSNHGHQHVLDELRLYSPLVGKESYIVVFDTVVEDLPADLFAARPWAPGDNPKTAVHEFLKENSRFEIDTNFNDRLMLSVAPDGFLRCTADP